MCAYTHTHTQPERSFGATLKEEVIELVGFKLLFLRLETFTACGSWSPLKLPQIVSSDVLTGSLSQTPNYITLLGTPEPGILQTMENAGPQRT